MSVLVSRTFITTCRSALIGAINADTGITPILRQIIEDPVNNPGISDFWFDVALSGPETTTFDNLLTSWACPTGEVTEPFEDSTALMFTSNEAISRSWLSIGTISNSSVGYSIPFNATIVGISYHVTSGGPLDIFLYTNGSLKASLVTLTPGNSTNTTLNIDVDTTEKIQIACGVGTTVIDVVVILYLSWRYDG